VITVILTPRLLRVRQRDYDADGYGIDEAGHLDLYRGKQLVGTVKAGGWVSVIVADDIDIELEDD
jgi:hypothetical protein